MNAIFTQIQHELEKSHDLVLVTILSQEGSSPRGAGAQMLVGENGRILGTVGGGAVEAQCEEHARGLLRQRQSGEKTFSLHRDGIGHAGIDHTGMVCGGSVTLWFQFVDASLPFWSSFAEAVLRSLSEHQAGWLVLQPDGPLPALLAAEGTALCGTWSGPVPPYTPGVCLNKEGQFFLPLPVEERAVVFGAGHCARALVPVLHKVGFRVTVLDDRREFAVPGSFPEAESVICGDFARISAYIQLSPSDYVVIMTSGHSHDFDVLRQVLPDPPVYVGVIGSRAKTAFVNQKLREAGFSPEVIQRVHAPIGTAIKAVTPEEIAISIAGEMIYERALIREARGGKTHGCPMHE